MEDAALKTKSLFLALVLLSFSALFPFTGDAAVTLSWNPPATNADGTPCTDLASYKIYYDSDRSGSPYSGTDLASGRSPILLPLTQLVDPSRPGIALSGMTPGTNYFFTVTAVDLNGNESGFSNEITAQETAAANQAPVANAGANQILSQSQLTFGSVQVTLNGAASSDPDANPLSYSWTQVQGSPVNLMGQNTANPFFSVTTALAGQALKFQLIVNDGQAESLPDTVQVFVEQTVSTGNSPPSPQIATDTTSGLAPLLVHFSGAATDLNGNVSYYKWSFGDGTASSQQNTEHTFSMPGKYHVSLSVVDDQGAFGNDTATITVLTSTTDGSTTSASDTSTTPVQHSNQDTDNDGLTDMQESNYQLDWQNPDSDGDGITDFIEWGIGTTPSDADGDGRIDALDHDSDNDGKPDAQEGVNDHDSDGALNYIDRDDADGPLGDQDGDGINNSREVTFLMNPNLSDSDGDGISDGMEFGPFVIPLDSEGDGVIDALDLDSDNDGTSDDLEGTVDTDQDGAPDYIDLNDQDGPLGDQDNDGLGNLEETLRGLNPNLSDSDLDGLSDPEEIGNLNDPVDSDGDGLADAVDADSDDDGIQDREELREDMNEDNIPDRLDPTIATFQTKLNKMALKVATNGCRLTDTKYIPEPIATQKWHPAKQFKYGGLQFTVTGVSIGGSVKLQIINKSSFRKFTTYWKYDPDYGYFKINPELSRNILTFYLNDGDKGDADHLVNGSISDPGFIEEPDDGTAASTKPAASSGGGGGGGCALQRHSTAFTGDFLFLLPLLLPKLLRKRTKV